MIKMKDYKTFPIVLREEKEGGYSVANLALEGCYSQGETVDEALANIKEATLLCLEDIDDLESVGYWDYLESEDRILCVEWIDRIEQAWPGEGILMALEGSAEGRRARMWGSREYARVLSDVNEEFARGKQTFE